ncbi:Mannose-specific lectin [Dendrobium catenatum]|uniref:Mannose-specific lectin n=1 Tax=Dendrobium catenatum TaxID=906689 RepID=A0A2I0WIZ1_9ASPA|nr:Mannose-specific lectin [Dendrobium catenatum]
MAISLSLRHASFCFMAVAVAALGLLAAGVSTAPTNQLLPGDILKTGQKISNANYTLLMQPDCNLVLYGSSSQAIWYTHTNDKGSECELRLQTDGNLAIHDKDGKLIWQTATNGTIGNYVLLMQRDHNVVLYGKPIWDSGTGSVRVPPTTY